MRAVLIVTIATGVLAVGACSKEPAAPAAGGPAPAAEAAAEQPPPPGNVNLAFADMGGAVEELASNYASSGLALIS